MASSSRCDSTSDIGCSFRMTTDGALGLLAPSRAQCGAQWPCASPCYSLRVHPQVMHVPCQSAPTAPWARPLKWRKACHAAGARRPRRAARVSLPNGGQPAHGWARGCTPWPLLPQHPHPSSLVCSVVGLCHALPACAARPSPARTTCYQSPDNVSPMLTGCPRESPRQPAARTSACPPRPGPRRRRGAWTLGRLQGSERWHRTHCIANPCGMARSAACRATARSMSCNEALEVTGHSGYRVPAATIIAPPAGACPDRAPPHSAWLQAAPAGRGGARHASARGVAGLTRGDFS